MIAVQSRYTPAAVVVATETEIALLLLLGSTVPITSVALRVLLLPFTVCIMLVPAAPVLVSK